MSVFEAIDRVKDLARAEEDGDPLAHRKIVEAVHKLQLQVESPFDTAMRVRFQPLQNMAVRVATEYGMLQAVAKSSDQEISAATLAQKTGADEITTERLMRIICYMGYCNEVGEDLYRANVTTMHVSTPGLLGGEKHHTDLLFRIGGILGASMRKQGGFYPSPPEGMQCPMEFALGHRFFEFMEVDDEQRQAFNDYMAARREGYQLQRFDIYPMADRIESLAIGDKKQVLICDVGGGQGHELAKLLARFPEVTGRLVLEDLESTFDGLSLTGKIEKLPHDFFQAQPVKDARFYYMRQIMHDWPDGECHTILKHIVEAMSADSRLLIDDYVMPPTDAELRLVHMDICMMMYLRSEERTERRWRNLLSSTGLELVKIWTPETGFESIIETRLKAA